MTSTPRPGWEKTVESQGLIFHSPNGQRYWDESAYYQLSAAEVDVLEKATNELQRLCLEAAQHIIDKKRYDELQIPAAMVPLIERTWNAEPPAICGRFDLAYEGGSKPPKLLEYNADTPTALLEAAVVQWYWLQDVFPKSDQFNSIHERLVAKWRDIKPYLTSEPLYFTGLDNAEDWVTISYLRDTAQQAEIQTEELAITDVGWDADRGCFVDLKSQPIGAMFKLYPWEWMAHESFGAHLSFDATRRAKDYDQGRLQWIEPPWKMLLSNKGILPILWELFPGHPNLLEAHLERGAMLNFVKKPLLSREGANITLIDGSVQLSTPGDYGGPGAGYVYQAVAPLPSYGGRYAILGSWVIDGESAGIGIRESDGVVTDNLSRFVPHKFD